MKPLAPLTVSFVVLLALVAGRELSRGGSSKSLVEEARQVELQTQPFAESDVAKIEVTAPGGDKPAFTLEKKDKSWRVMQPFVAPASGAAVTKLAGILSKAQGEFRADDSSVLEQFDLTAARSVGVQAYDKDGKTLAHLAIGASSMTHGAFVRNLANSSDAGKALAIADDIRGALGLSRSSPGHEPDKPEFGHFHEKEVAQFKTDKAKHLEISAPGRVLAFDKVKKDEKDTQGEWKPVKAGVDDPLRKEGVETALRGFSGGLHPMGLIDPAKKAELGFDAPKYRIALTDEDGTTHAFTGSSDASCAHWYVRLDAPQDPEVLYEASEYEFHQLFPRGTSLFDCKLPEIPDTDLGTIEVTASKNGAARTIRMTRTATKPGDDWTLASPGFPLTAKQSSLRGVAGALKSLRPVDYVDPGIDVGAAEISIGFGPVGAKSQDLRHVLIGGKAPAGRDRIASVDGGKHAWVLNDSTVERLVPELLSLLESQLLHGWSAEDVKSIRVDGPAPDFAARWSLVRDGATWTIVRGDDRRPADPKAADDWVRSLLALEVRAVRGDTEGARPESRLSIENAKGEPVAILVLPLEKESRWVRAGGLEFESSAKDVAPDPASLEKKPDAPKPDAPKDEKPKEGGDK